MAAGETFCSQGLVHSILHHMGQKARGHHACDQRPATGLTRRELEIVRLIAEHLSNKQIARQLSLSLYTVKNHVHNIVDKLHVTGRYEAVDYAREQRWLGAEKRPASGHSTTLPR